MIKEFISYFLAGFLFVILFVVAMVGPGLYTLKYPENDLIATLVVATLMGLFVAIVFAGLKWSIENE